jgi:predicted nucleic acid-binding protein
VTTLVDSDILIEVSRGRNVALVHRWNELSNSDVAILYSPVSAAELWGGARPKEYEDLADLLRSLTCIPIGEEIGKRAGTYLRQYGPSHGVEVPDALIAASAASSNAQLWTRNRKHYPMKDVTFFE